MRIIAAFFLIFSFSFIIGATNDKDSFFRIKSIKFYPTQPKKGPWPYREFETKDRKRNRVFIPFLEVTVKTKMQISALGLYAKAYFYDKKGHLIASAVKPYPVDKGEGLSDLPAIFPEAEDVTIYYEVTNEVLKEKDWRAVIIFGDKNEAVAKVYPRGDIKSLSFPEQQTVENPVKVKRENAADPLIEYVVKTGIDEQPQITLFLRRPVGMEDFSEAKGVLALCVLASGVADIKRRLQTADVKDELSGVLRFAEKHKLAILCWGSRSFWNPRANWDEMAKRANKNIDRNFDAVARAWGRGVDKLAEKYGIPKEDFLLWGASGSAQYSARLALRMPKYFLAVRIHIPSSFDEPTIEGNRILWCLSTGEEEGGYERSLKFLEACKKLGYPIIYKAIPGLGHSGHPITEALGLAFFEYALTLRDEKANFLAARKRLNSETAMEWNKNPRQLWPVSFREPKFIGDIYRQTAYPFGNVPDEPGIRIPLPTKKLAEAWLGTTVSQP